MKLAVIGRGLIGSAAARHLSAAGYDVTLIGPSEPQDFATHKGTFASHYDEGRITRGLDPDPFWSAVSRASIARYADIERQSGIRFYREVGVLMTGPSDHPPIRDVERIAQDSGLDCETLDDAGLKSRFPYFAFPLGSFGLFEGKDAGYISPRALVRAQGVCVERNGGRIVDTVVQGIDETNQGVRLTTTEGQMTFDKALVATGGFAETLLGSDFRLKVCARTVALFRLGPQELQRLSAMPSHIHLTYDGLDPYYLPPIPYPDGHSYVKLGGDPEDIVLPTTADVNDWFRSGGSEQVGDFLEDLIRARIPDLQADARILKPCVTSYTNDGMPDIRRLSDRVAIAVGGNGKGAKNSDELGRLGANALLGH
jgi:sarcosine oxidase